MISQSEIERLVNSIKDAGFEVEYFPEKREIRIKGRIKRVDFFGVQEIILSNKKMAIYYSRYDGDNIIEIDKDDDIDDDGNDAESFYLGRDLEVLVRFENPYLIIIFLNESTQNKYDIE